MFVYLARGTRRRLRLKGNGDCGIKEKLCFCYMFLQKIYFHGNTTTLSLLYVKCSSFPDTKKEPSCPDSPLEFVQGTTQQFLLGLLFHSIT
ncbi:hypothetical protein SAMN05216244_2817 [Sediminibacillus halophilus]|uniref:Uncharacterized protein n=1 Tax=Sediminibacillus halophilus TaxID=482461 RepID=A0A1G9U169_9BACI|nr:hypothetical protein SAMN05216244_2817 [Sediminibacillus halophilus]